MEFLTKKQIEAIKKMGLFDFLTNHGHELKKEELISMFREFNYAVYDMDKTIELKAVNEMIEALQDADEGEEDEEI